MTYGWQWWFQYREREIQLVSPSDTSSETPPHSWRNNSTRNVCYNAMNLLLCNVHSDLYPVLIKGHGSERVKWNEDHAHHSPSVISISMRGPTLLLWASPLLIGDVPLSMLPDPLLSRLRSTVWNWGRTWTRSWGRDGTTRMRGFPATFTLHLLRMPNTVCS